MKMKLAIVTISVAALAISADCHAMMRRAAPVRAAAQKRVHKAVRVPQRSFGFKKEANLFLEEMKKEVESHKNHIKKQLSEDHAELGQMRKELNQFTKDLPEVRIHPQQIAKQNYIENDKNSNEEERELEFFKVGISLELSEAEIELCKATNNMKKYDSVDFDKLLEQHQDLFIEDSLDVQKLDLAVWDWRERLNSINELHQMLVDVNELERNAKLMEKMENLPVKVALADAVKNQMQSKFKPKC